MNAVVTATATATATAAQVPYWVAVLTPEERSFGSRRTDPRIDTVDSSVVTTVRTQWTGADLPNSTTLLAVLADTVGSWQSDRCRSCASGVLVDIESSPSTYFPVRLPTRGHVAALIEEVRRRIAGAPNGGSDYRTVKNTLNSPALDRKQGAQIAFRYGTQGSTADKSTIPDESEPLTHSLTVTCETTVVDGVTMLDTDFRWNCRIFTRADVDDFERFWEKTISIFV